MVVVHILFFLILNSLQYYNIIRVNSSSNEILCTLGSFTDVGNLKLYDTTIVSSNQANSGVSLVVLDLLN